MEPSGAAHSETCTCPACKFARKPGTWVSLDCARGCHDDCKREPLNVEVMDCQCLCHQKTKTYWSKYAL